MLLGSLGSIVKIKFKNLNGPALSSYAERAGAEVDFFKHGGRVVK